MTLRETRGKLGLTQKALAARLGVASNTVARWESGVNPLPLWAALFVSLLAQSPPSPPKEIREPQIAPQAKSGGR